MQAGLLCCSFVGDLCRQSYSVVVLREFYAGLHCSSFKLEYISTANRTRAYNISFFVCPALDQAN